MQLRQKLLLLVNYRGGGCSRFNFRQGDTFDGPDV